MRLAGTVVDRLMTALSRQPDGRRFDAGATPRVGLHATVTVVPYGGEAVAAMTATVGDAWDEGLAMTCPAPLAAGHAVAVLVPCGQRKPLRVLCTVSHCRPAAGGDGYVVSAAYGASAVDSLAHVLALPRRTLLAAA